MRVVLADDHAGMRQAVASLLESRFETVLATRGDEAVDVIRRLDPDFALLDVSMPGLSGLEAAAVLQAEGRRARILFLSGDSSDELVEASLAAGGLGFVPKLRLHQDLLAAFDHVHHGRMFVPRASAFVRVANGTERRHGLLTGTHDRMAAAAAYLFAAWRSGHALVAVAPAADLANLAVRLEHRGVDVSRAASQGRYWPIDADAALEAIQHHGDIDAERFTALFGPLIDSASLGDDTECRHVSAFGHIAPILCAAGRIDAAIEVERIATEFLQPRPLSILCACHPAGGQALTADEGDRLAAAHTTIIASAL